MKPAALRARILGTVGIFFALFSIAFGRVVQLCVMQAGVLGELASQQQRQQVTLPPDRGPIVDRHGDTLAVTVESADVYLRPRMAQLPEQLIPLVAQTCDLPATLIAAKAHAAAPFVWVQRQATPEQGAAVEALGVRGLGSASSRRRLYPRGALAGQVIGFAGVDLQGLAGVELQYDSDLRRASTSFRMDRDARGGFMLTEGAEEMPLRPGVRLELTLDGGLQQVAEDELEVAVKTRTPVAAAAAAAVSIECSDSSIVSRPSASPRSHGARCARSPRQRCPTPSSVRQRWPCAACRG